MHLCPQVLLIIEILSVAFTLVYIYLAAKKKAVSWIFGILGSLLSVYLFFNKDLPGSAILNIVYALLGVFGFFYWKSYISEKKPGYELRWPQHALWLFVCAGVAFVAFRLLKSCDYEAALYIDLFLATGSVLATVLEIKKDTSCWWYWIVCNISYAALYVWQSVSQGEPLYIYAILMMVLAVFSYFGLREWTREG